MSNIRIGIDVGGTFTHAVAIEGESGEVVGHSVVPTTHAAKEGVAMGIVASLEDLIQKTSLNRSAVTFIAHSTTQATNALLEGDVAKVGIIGMGKGLEMIRARGEMNVGRIKLQGGKWIDTFFDFIDANEVRGKREEVRGRVKKLIEGGANSFVSAEAFSVDDPTNEDAVAGIVRENGFPCVATHDISGLYGLRARTRTSAVNASILPKMLEAANMTEGAVSGSGISAALMVMRSDGGVLSLKEARTRPILTILSGPAAGVAAALMYEKISDGIFLEVGGTSTDITVIKDGRAIVRSAEIGGQRLYLKTLDVRTIGVAGGSMPRVSDGGIIDVGPRSAHIAGLPYSCFSDPGKIKGGKTIRFKPKESDPADYVAVRSTGGPDYALTVTCAANVLGLVPHGDWAQGNRAAASEALSALAEHLKISVEDVARKIMDISAGKFIPVLEGLIKEYKLDRENVFLVGGGGGACAIVPYLAEKMKVPYRIAKNNPIISAIGVALALLHEAVERSVINPTDSDVIKIRKEAEQKIISMGADPSSVEVEVEVDGRRNVLKASAFGASELRKKESASYIGDEAAAEICAKSMRIPGQSVKLLGKTSALSVYGARLVRKRFFNLFSEAKNPIRVIDKGGVMRLRKRNALVAASKASLAVSDLASLLETQVKYGDAGERIPAVFILAGGKVLNLSGLTERSQILGLAGIELEGAREDEPVVMILSID